ncbi:MAG: exodeoxyribonuclease VII large subunit [Bacillota bacterium]
MSEKRAFTVREVNDYIKKLMETDILLSHVSVKGEISNYKLHSSGHAYFTLKDSESRIKCVMFKSSCMKLRFVPEDGMEVVVRGHFSVYERDGQYQLYAEDMAPEGTGALYKAFEQLKKRLAEEGLFNQEIKKKIPYLPAAVGIVTSPTGAAVRDIISIIKRRCPLINIILYPVQVQGEIAASEVAEGIRYFNEQRNVDVIIAGRGGGSIEELWAFNEEIVARAIYMSKIPIISAVGHETDFTIADFAADIRAATPSAAAELVAPELNTLMSRLNQAVYGLQTSMNSYITDKRMKVEYISRDSAFRKIEQKLMSLTQTLDFLNRDLESCILRIIKDSNRKLLANIEKLDILNPAAALLRGFTITRRASDNTIVSSVSDIHIGERLELELRDGCITASVTDKNENNYRNEV